MLQLIRIARMATHAITPILAIAGTALSQETRPTTVPADLVAALVGVPPDAITVGAVPDGVPFDVPVPAGAEVLGGMSRNGQTSVVISVPAGRGDAVQAVEERLRTTGWEPAPDPMPNRRPGGFVSSPSARSMGLCRDGAHATVSAARTATPGRTSVRLSFTEPRPGSMCSPDMAVPVGSRVPMPTLTAPDQAEMRGGGGGFSNLTGESDARIETAMPVADLVTHFHDQLVEQNWTPVEQATAEHSALFRYSFEDDRGRWYGALIITRRGDTDVLDLSFDVIGANAR